MFHTAYTVRDIYYRDPELFKSQKVVDRYVDMVAYTCGVTRFDLNVVSAHRLRNKWLENHQLTQSLDRKSEGPGRRTT